MKTKTITDSRKHKKSKQFGVSYKKVVVFTSKMNVNNILQKS